MRVPNSRKPLLSITIPGLTLARALVHAWPPLTDQVGGSVPATAWSQLSSVRNGLAQRESRMTRDDSRERVLDVPGCHRSSTPLRVLNATFRYIPALFHKAQWCGLVPFDRQE